MKRLKRLFALTLAVFMFTVTPFSDYIRAREEAQAAAVAPAVPVLAGAAKFIFDLLLSVLGVHMAGEMLGGFVDALGEWVKVDGRYVTVFNKLIEDSAKWTYGEVVSISKEAISMIRDFLKTQKGYGTETGIEKIQYGAVSPAFEDSVTYKNNIDLSSLNPPLDPADYSVTIPTLTGEFDIYIASNCERFGGYITPSVGYDENYKPYNYFNLSLYGIKNGVRNFLYSSIAYRDGVVYSKVTDTKYGLQLPLSTYLEILDTLPFPIYDNADDMGTFLSTGVIGETVNNYSDYAFETDVESAPDIQGREIETDGTIAIPGTEAEILELLTSIKEAVTAKEREKALAPTLTVIYGGKSNQEEPEEPNEKFPWLPDITGPIKKLGSSLDDVKAFVKNIPGSLSDILKAIKAIPGNIEVIIDEASGKILERFTPLIDGMQSVVTAVQGIPQHLLDILNGIKAMPGQMVDALANLFNSNDDDLDPNKWQINSDIVNKFPFCIPFDLFACIQLFSETSLRPRWEIPFTVGSLGVQESIIIDLSTDDWQPLVMVIRLTTLVGYCIGLIVLTRGLIKG
ncbi:hypothetical protein [Clostridium sp. Marseille-P2415]|uniref:hypothetical protein n=1 Tax=Clostridium sp. Marseille-P2415 TaxID=1805471 RepID=UPI0009888065|nr:hypothetical protein [Clostridium sp. Marseille-P2415]